MAGTDVGALDGTAIDRVREEARPNPRDPDELHDALMTAGTLNISDLETFHPSWLETLAAAGRATCVQLPTIGPDGAASSSQSLLVAAERLPELRALHPNLASDPPVQVPASRVGRIWTREGAVAELVRGRLTIAGPTTAEALGCTLGISAEEVGAGLTALESEGVVLRGSFTSAASRGSALEWCDRALLARIHRYTLTRLRAEIEPVTPADFMRFLFRWQHVHTDAQLTGLDGLREAIALLDGFELPTGAWERAVLPTRVHGYDPSALDMLCLTGEVGWARLSAPRVLRLVSATPVALFLREHEDVWQTLRAADLAAVESMISEDSRIVLERLRGRGPSFFDQLADAVPFDLDRLRQALALLVAAGLTVSDGFSGLRLLVAAGHGRRVALERRRNFSGRWSATPANHQADPGEKSIEHYARTLLRRYGVVFRRLLAREGRAVPWRELVRVYRRMEARGDIRGGRFISGMSGEQYALPDAVTVLREVRRTPLDGQFHTICTADPLNLTGIVTAGERVRATARNRLAYRDGIPVGVMERDTLRALVPLEAAEVADMARTIGRRRVPILGARAVRGASETATGPPWAHPRGRS